MKRAIWLRACLAATVIWLAVSVVASPPAPVARAAPRAVPVVAVLPSGLTVSSDLQPDADTVSIAVSVRAGARDEDDGYRGGAHWLEHLVFLGSQRYPTQTAIFSAISDAGGFFDAVTDNETTTFVVTMPRDSFQLGLDVLSDVLTHPLFPPAAADQERGVVISEVERLTSSATNTAIETFGGALLGTVARNAGATPKSVAALQLADAIAFYAKHYTARNVAVAVVGPLPSNFVAAAVAVAFSGLPSGTATVTPLLPAQERMRVQGGSSSLVLVGQRVPGMSSVDAAALEVLDSILDVPGTRIADAIHAGKKTASGGTRIILYSDAGLWTAVASGDPDETLSIVQQQLRRLQTERVPDDEVQVATRYFAGRILLGGEPSSSQAIILARRTAFGTPQTVQQHADAVLAVTAAEIQRVANAYFKPDTLSVLSSKPSGSGN